MKKSILVLSAIVIMLGFSAKMIAQVTLSGNLAGAELVVALTIANPTPLNFGVIAIPTEGISSVTMTTAGVRTSNGCNLVASAGTSAPAGGTVAIFNLTGTAGDTYFFHLPASITLSKDGAPNMTINQLVTKTGTGNETSYNENLPHTLSGGTSSVLVAGTLNIGDGQVLGVYAGTYNVTVDYL
jgi:hypothetical protein